MTTQIFHCLFIEEKELVILPVTLSDLWFGLASFPLSIHQEVISLMAFPRTPYTVGKD